MSDERDPVVARALRELSVPEHGPGFWEGLEARLAAEDAPRRREATAAPAVGLSADETGDETGIAAVVSLEEARIRRGTRRGRIVAVASVAAGLLVGAAVLRSSPDGSELRTAGPPESTTAQPDPGPRAKTNDAGAEDAVVEWFEALADGNAAAASELLGPRSRRYLDALRIPVERYVRESQAYGAAWAASTDWRTTEFRLPAGTGDDIRIVVVSGTWNDEYRMDSSHTDAIPAVRSADGRWLVEPVAIDPARGGRIEMISPKPGENGLSAAAPGAVLEVEASGGGTFFFSLDAGALDEVEGRPAGGGVRGSFDPPGEMASGNHSLLVAYVDGDTIAAFATTFLVEG